MKWVLYVYSMICIVFGSFAVLYTTQYRDMMRKFLEKTDLKILALFPFIGGILIFLCASASHYPWFIRVISILGIVKGIFIFTNPNKIANRLNSWYLNSLSDQTHRFFGIVWILFGSAVFSWIL